MGARFGVPGNQYAHEIGTFQGWFLPKNVKTTICAVSGSMDAGIGDNYLGLSKIKEAPLAE